MKTKSFLLLSCLFMLNVYSSPPTRTYTYTSGNTIEPAEVSTNENNIYSYLQSGVDTLASNSVATANIVDGTITNADISSSAAIADSKLAQITTASKVDGASITGAINATTVTASTGFLSPQGSYIAYGFSGDSNTYMYSGAADQIGFTIGGNANRVLFEVNDFSINQANVIFPNISTTASAANAFLDGAANNEIYRSTSSGRYKKEVNDINKDEIDILSKLRPITFKSKIETDDQTKRFFGFIAEEVEQVAPNLCFYMKDEQGNKIPDGVQYDRLTVLLVAKVQELEKRIEKLEKK